MTDSTTRPPRTGPFALVRDVDATGISGTGRVAQGYVFEDGTAVLRWLSEHRSTAVYESLAEVEAIHGHNGSTRIEAEAAAPDAGLREALEGLASFVDESAPSEFRWMVRFALADARAALAAHPVPAPGPSPDVDEPKRVAAVIASLPLPAGPAVDVDRLAASLWTASDRHDEMPWIDAGDEDRADTLQWAGEIVAEYNREE